MCGENESEINYDRLDALREKTISRDSQEDSSEIRIKVNG